eukprot:442749_1
MTNILISKETHVQCVSSSCFYCSTKCPVGNRIYNERMMQNEPPSPEKYILDKLTYLQPKHWSVCPHYLYLSSLSFINHILWTIYPVRLKINERTLHSKVLLEILKSAIMCIECINLLLSLRELSDMMVYFLPIPNTPKYIRNLRCLIVHQVCVHPKAYKTIMSNDCKKYVRKTFMDVIFFSLIHCDEKKWANHSCVVGICVTIYLSIAHWNKRMIVYFVKENFGICVLRSVLRKWIENETHAGCLNQTKLIVLLCLIYKAIMQKVKQLPFKHRKIIYRQKEYKPSVLKAWNTLVSLRKANYIKSRNDVKKWIVTCSWYGCRKLQSNKRKSFKVCSQCKMAYYCSRSCQKKSWVHHHRNICSVLKKCYTL